MKRFSILSYYWEIIPSKRKDQFSWQSYIKTMRQKLKKDSLSHTQQITIYTYLIGIY